MSKKVTKPVQCLLCNGKHSHLSIHCKIMYTGPNGNEHKKIQQITKLMNGKNKPNFDAMTIQTLRLIAVNFVYDNSLYDISMRTSARIHPNIDKDRQYNPIPLTLSKNRLKKELIKKWEFRQKLLEKKEKVPEIIPEHTCPICYEEMGEYTWCDNKYIFRTRGEIFTRENIETHPGDNCCSAHISTIDMLFNEGHNPIKTTCGHIMCSSCWSKIAKNTNFRTESDYVSSFKRCAPSRLNQTETEITNRLHEFYSGSCPMCRTETYATKRLGVDKDSNWDQDISRRYFMRPRTYTRDWDILKRWNGWIDSPSIDSHIVRTYGPTEGFRILFDPTSDKS